MKKRPSFLLAALSGILLSAAWPVSPLTALIFIAWTPLLWLEYQGISRRKFFGWTYLTMLIWNTAATWWIWNASAPGAIGAILANSLLMCLPWLGFHFVKSRAGERTGYLSLIAFWLSFEYLHLHDWGLSWPWLTLGNVFATHTDWIQWYEFTGVSGGSAWIMIVNLLLFLLLRKKWMQATFHKGYALSAAAALALPLLASLYIRHTAAQPAETPQQGSNIVIVQPNIDPYEKLETGSFDAQLNKLLRLSESALDSHTVLVIWPETAIYMENGIEEDKIKQNYFLNPLWDFLRRHPHLNLLTGIETFRKYKGPETATAFRFPDADVWYDSYNAAMILDSTGSLAVYHKSRLVPGVETLPPYLKFIAAWFEKFGGTTGGYAGQAERTVMPTSNHSYKIAPSICYESIYGEFMSAYTRNGADLIAVITNDGWWGNTPGYHQHENYARLRAIEARRWLVRSANTGVSCIIDPYGKIIDPQPWAQPAVIKASVPANKTLTFYVKHGDLLSPVAVTAAILLFAWTLLVIIKNRKERG
jgi:apolipoprotein N-acyltransferase